MELQAEREWMHVSHEYYCAALRSKETIKTVLRFEIMIISLFCWNFFGWKVPVWLQATLLRQARNARSPQRSSAGRFWLNFMGHFRKTESLTLNVDCTVHRSYTLFLESIHERLTLREASSRVIDRAVTKLVLSVSFVSL